jgi:hypothetical protein
VLGQDFAPPLEESWNASLAERRVFDFELSTMWKMKYASCLEDNEMHLANLFAVGLATQAMI